MSHNIPLITTFALAFSLALLFGFLAFKLKLPTLVGYLLAGVIIGPFTPGLVANSDIAKELAEIGVMLLMFGVGLHFSLDDLLDVKKIALPGAIVQILVATCMGAFVANLWGWPLGASIVFGLALSVASTVVLLRALESRGILESINGRIAVGWLVVEDLAMVIALVLLPALASWMAGTSRISSNLWITLTITILKVSAFIMLMLIVGRRFFPKLLWQVAKTKSRELFTLCVIAAAVSIAYAAAKLFGVSFALGAFFAGMIIRESKFSRRAAEESLPFRDAFAVLFFVSVGMLFDPRVIINEPWQTLTVVGIIIIGKSIAAFLLVLAFRYPLSTALIVSASLAQIGEFSFILTELGIRLNVLPVEGRSYIVAGALISIALNPFVFRWSELILIYIRGRTKIVKFLDKSKDDLAELPFTTNRKYLAGQAVLVGFGQVGRQIADVLTERGIPYIIVEQNRELVERLRIRGIPAVCGDISEPMVLVQAHIAHAGILIITVSDSFNLKEMINTAKQLNPTIEIVANITEEHDEFLKPEGIEKIFFAEDELAKNMSSYVLDRFGQKT
ncbi:MAG: cation:proton antiporter [Proteobacteria bacterium]|nr:cation:proton antiporter [Pseudomonadota bacterium]